MRLQLKKIAIAAAAATAAWGSLTVSSGWFDEAAADRAVKIYQEQYFDPAPGYYFDEHAAKVAIDLYPRHLCLSSAEWAGQRFVLAEWQAARLVAPVFGWKREVDGTRRYRQVILWVPRKNGKTEFAAGTSLLHLTQDGEKNGQIYCIAAKEEQSRIVFDAASRMVAFSSTLRPHMELLKTSIFFGRDFSRIQPLSGQPTGTHGKSPSVIIGDEVHEWKDDRLYKFLSQGSGARRQPIEWLISTAGLTEGFGWELWGTSTSLQDGTLEDPETLVVIFAADEDDDIWDPATWRKANPNFGISPKESFFQTEVAKAKRSARAESDFRRYHLNIWTGQSERWLPIDKWNDGNGDVSWKDKAEQLRGRPCFGGGDMASVQDLCSVGWLFPPHGGDDNWHWLPLFWMPRGDSEADLYDRVRHERVPYDIWEADGAITITEGNAADHNLIRDAILLGHEMFDVQGFGMDPWNAHQLQVDLVEAGVDLVKVSTTIASLTSACKHLERLVLDRRIIHGGHPILRWNVGNVVIQRDTKDNFMPNKLKSTQKIDGVVAGLNALAVAGGEQEDGLIDFSYLEALG